MLESSVTLAPRQLEFIFNSTRKWNIAHGSVRSGKTVCTLYRFMQAAWQCPDNQIFMVGHSADTIYNNAIRLLLESEQLSIFRPFCTWYPGKRQLHFRNKTIQTLGAKNEGAVGHFQGLTMSLVYCDEMTLYPDSIIQMINSRLSLPYSMGFASMNPKHPTHILKKWIDAGLAGDKSIYSLHFSIDDNPYIPEEYKEFLRRTSSGIFYKRNYLGEWCLAEGAIFDFFDRTIHVVPRAPRAADYYIAGVDYGISNAFACLIIGVSTGVRNQIGKQMWVEREYYYDSKKTHKQKTNSEFADELEAFLDPYGVRMIYIDPSALAMKVEMRKRGMRVADADNDVENGIQKMTSEMAKGNLLVCAGCKNLIEEIENYVWDDKKSREGVDAPVKKGDHAIDALRYCIQTHKVTEYQPYQQGPQNYNQRFEPFGHFR